MDCDSGMEDECNTTINCGNCDPGVTCRNNRCSVFDPTYLDKGLVSYWSFDSADNSNLINAPDIKGGKIQVFRKWSYTARFMC